MVLRLLLGFLLLASPLITYCQLNTDDSLKKVITQLQQYQLSRPYEKVHLHLDKPYYAIGDKIWFKAYVVQAEKNQPSNFSKILYVDLIDESDSIKQTLKLPLFFGLAWGEFGLSDTLKEGNYRMRAYTNWMRNFGEDYFFDRTIAVGDAITNNIITSVNYNYTKEGTAQRVLANLTYNDINGNPIADKEVSYIVKLGTKSVNVGKGKTDGAGKLGISFTNNASSAQIGTIATAIKLDEKRTVSKNLPIKSTSNDSDIQFFPEGGSLVSGLASIVGFKALDADGHGIKVSGLISDNNNNRIAEFKSEHQGMGYFAFRPQPEAIYNATVKFEDGSEKKVDLPVVQPTGYILSVNNKDAENLQLTISSSIALADQEVTLMAQSNNKIHFVSKSKLNGSRITATIPKKRFPEGILQLTE